MKKLKIKKPMLKDMKKITKTVEIPSDDEKID